MSDSLLETLGAEAAVQAMKDAIEALPVTERPAQRSKFLAMLVNQPSRLFLTKVDVVSAGSADQIIRAVLQPSEFHLNAIAAVRAGNLNWDIE